MKRLSLLLLCAGLWLQSFASTVSAQETATPPEGAAAPAAAPASDAPRIETTTTTTTTATLIGPEADSSPSAKAAQFEMTKRQELAFSANQAITDGNRLLEAGQLDAAAERFKYAMDSLPEGGTSAPAYQKAAQGLAEVRVQQGNAAMKGKSYAAAVKCYEDAAALNPSNSAIRSKLANAKAKQKDFDAASRDVAGTENNPALTPEFKEKTSQIQKLFFEGDRLYDTGQYDAAENRYMQILALDSYNKAARGRLERLDRTKGRMAEKMRETTRKDAMYKVTDLWSEKVPADYAKKSTQTQTSEGGESKLARMIKKLQDMRIQSLNFNQADIQTVVQVLTAKSRELDPTKNGINFVLKTEMTTVSKPAAAGADAAAAAAPAPAAVIPPVTINLQDVPMMEALRFISSITNLQVKVEEYAVFLLPQNDVSGVLQTRTFAVPGGFFEGGLKAASSKPGSTETTKVDTVKMDVKQQLIDKGVQFPEGATAAFLSGSSRLVVKNTPDQLDIIDALIRNNSIETPQVEIETRLAEFTDDQLKALSFQYGLTLNNGVGAPPSNFNFSGQTNLNDAQSGILPNNISSLLNGTSAVNSTSIALSGVIGGNSWTALISAIDQLKGVDLLSAPKVTAKNRTRAKVEIVRELRYPSEFERPTVNTTPFAVSGIQSGFVAEQGIVYLALPASPRQFTVKPIGVTMEVTPTTYPDQRIDLELQPDVTDFEGFINYGQAIRIRSSNENPDQQGSVETASIVNQPVFNVRSISTKVQVLDGQTVILGGLIREDRQMINDKVPFLGDLPGVGRLFRSKVEQSLKKNLMIFVTARLVKSDGKALYNQELVVASPNPEAAGN